MTLLEETLHLKEVTIEELERVKQTLYHELLLKNSLLEQLQGTKNSLANIQLTWKEGPKASIKLRREPDAVLDGDIIYFKYFWGINIYSFNLADQSWVNLPTCPVSSFSMAVLDGLITIIGGKSTDLAAVSTLYSYSGEEWVQKYPHMHVERYWTMSTKCETSLIVMGGEGKDRRVLSTVEVLDLETQQWSFASNLPRPMDSATSAICGNHLYVGGGSHPDTARYVAMCSLPQLLGDLHKEQLSVSASLSRKEVWCQIDDFPYLKTSLTSVGGYLFTLGGKDEANEATPAVYVFNDLSKKWEKVSEMTHARSSCFAVSLPSNEIMVVGGINESVAETGKLVEIATLVTAS